MACVLPSAAFFSGSSLHNDTPERSLGLRLGGIAMSDAAVPSTEQVQSYLAQHSLEAVIEDAVNEAVLRQNC